MKNPAVQTIVLLAGLGLSATLTSCALILGDKDYVDLDTPGAGGATATGSGGMTQATSAASGTTAQGSSTGTCGENGCGGAASTSVSSSSSTSSTAASTAASTASSTAGSTASSSSSSSSSSSTGSGGEPPCGQGGPLTDSFTGNTLDPTRWGLYTNGVGSTVSQNNQVAVFVTGADGSSAGVYSKVRFPLAGCSASIKVLDAPKVVGITAYFLLSSQLADADQLAFAQSGNYLNLEVKLTGGTKASKQISFIKGTHVYWRFRASPAGGGTVYWETSATGATWQEQFSYPAASLGFPIDMMQVNFGSSAYGGPSTTIHFDSFNLIP